MDKYKKYYGILLFLGVALLTVYLAYNTVMPKIENFQSSKAQVAQKQSELNDLKAKSKNCRK